MVLPLACQPHVIYRFFDAAGVLLYIGLTNDLATRWSAHRDKKWWGAVATITVERFGNRYAAEAAEKAAIKAERPQFNVTHRRGPKRRSTATTDRFGCPIGCTGRMVLGGSGAHPCIHDPNKIVGTRLPRWELREADQRAREANAKEMS